LTKICRDIKGGNILVDEFGIVKLADFGASSRMLAGKTVDMTAIKGTPFFMAPEVLKEGNDLSRSPEDIQTNKTSVCISNASSICPLTRVVGKHGRKGDVWAVGCTIIQMLTGEPPWQNKKLNGLAGLYQLSKLLEALQGTCYIATSLVGFYFLSFKFFMNLFHFYLSHILILGVPEFVWPEEEAPCAPLISCLERCFIKDYERRPYVDELLGHEFIVDQPLKDDEFEDSLSSSMAASLKSTSTDMEDHNRSDRDMFILRKQMERVVSGGQDRPEALRSLPIDSDLLSTDADIQAKMGLRKHLSGGASSEIFSNMKSPT
jgi:serine/threonine protein kinase